MFSLISTAKFSAQKLLRKCLVISYVLVVGSFAWAQVEVGSRFPKQNLSELSLDELFEVEIYAASKVNEPIFETPAVVSVVTDSEIELFGGRDLGEILSRIPGVEPWDSSTSGRFQLTVRGDRPLINNNHVLILLDGTPLNRESYTGGIWTQAMLQSIPLPILERIEVVRGPGSVLYGTNAYSGVINLVTRQSSGLPNQVTISLGNHNSKSLDLSLSANVGKWDIVSALRLRDTDGMPFQTVTTSGSVFREDEFSKSPGAMLVARRDNFKATAFWGKTTQFTLRGNPSEPVKGSNTNEKYFFELRQDWHIEGDTLVTASASHVGGRTTQQFAIPTGLGELNYITDDSRLEISARKPLAENVQLLVGSTLDYFSGSTPPPVQLLPAWSQRLFGVYSQLEIEIGETELFVGGQYSRSSNGYSDFVPRAGLIREFGDYFGFKLFYGQAFRAPYAAETDIDVGLPSITIRGNRDLNPEEVTTYEAQLFYAADHIHAAVTVFRNEQTSLISRVPVAPTSFSFANDGGLEIEGLEIEFKRTIQEDWYLSGSYTYQHNEDNNGRKDTTLQPSSILKGGLGYTGNGWSLGIFDTYFEAHKDNVIVNPDRVEVNPPPSSYHRLSANLIFDLSKQEGWTLTVYADNLLGENVYLPVPVGTGFSPQNTLPILSGATVRASLTKRF